MITHPNDLERFDKLPKWAQQYITGLWGEYTATRMALALRNPHSSIGYSVGLNIWSGLPEDSTIRFAVGTDQVHCNLTQEGELRIATNRNPLHIEPRASNCIIIR